MSVLQTGSAEYFGSVDRLQIFLDEKLQIWIRTLKAPATTKYLDKGRAIAGTTARCAQYMSAQIIM